ncbi:MAG: DUF72 domain-containing protein [Promethearchaeota archaeon]
MEIRIGTGGWVYFNVSNYLGMDNLTAYSKAFDYVEVNSTFYEIPSLELVTSWRKRVSEEFEFSVRCHRSITHQYLLEPVPEALDNFKIMTKICRQLRASYLHILTPSQLEFTHRKIEAIRDFFSTVDTAEVRLVWEPRSLGAKIDREVVKIMEDHDIVHCVDLSRQSPLRESDVLYSRLFGKGRHTLYQFTDNELKEINQKARELKARKIMLAFHGIRMYKDAARLKVFLKSGSFPRVTKKLGIESLQEVLMEDARFPITKKALLEKQGWKVIDLAETERAHASYYLELLPEGIYDNLEEIIRELQN